MNLEDEEDEVKGEREEELGREERRESRRWVLGRQMVRK